MADELKPCPPWETLRSIAVGERAIFDTRKGPRIMEKHCDFSYTVHRPDLRKAIASMILDGAPDRPSFTSPDKLTKRQRRRLRGKESA